MMSSTLFIATIFLLVGATFGQTTEDGNESIPAEDPMIYFNPKNLIAIKENNTVAVDWFTTLPGASDAYLTAEDESVSKIVNWTHNFDVYSSENYTGYGTFYVETIFLGHGSFNLTIVDINNNTLGSAEIIGTVILPYQTINVIFTYSILFLSFVAYINMGAALDLDVVLRSLKRPIGPVVGLISQYTIMPVAAYGLAHLFFPGEPLSMLGMFLIGSSPGGGLSNIWTYLFRGSLDLSITMTLTSTLCAFAAVPLWVFTLGPTIFAGTDFQIPFVNIVGLVLILIIPCGIGILMQFYLPKIALFIKNHVLKKIALFNTIFVLTFGAYSYRYVFSMFTPMSLLASFLLPICGYLCGFGIATLVRRPKVEKIAIAIETGVQNAQIPILILKLSLGSPTGDLAIVVPAAIIILTPLTLLAIYTIRELLTHFCRAKKANISSSKEEGLSKGKTNESFDQHASDKNIYPIIPMDTEKGYPSHTNPGFVTEEKPPQVVHPKITIDEVDGQKPESQNGDAARRGSTSNESSTNEDEHRDQSSVTGNGDGKNVNRNASTGDGFDKATDNYV